MSGHRPGASKSAKMRAHWADPAWRREQLMRLRAPETRSKLSASTRRAWSDPKKRARMLKAMNRPAAIAAHAEHGRRMWLRPKHRALMLAAHKIEWTPRMVRALEAMQRVHHPSVQAIANMLGINRETVRRECERRGIDWRVTRRRKCGEAA